MESQNYHRDSSRIPRNAYPDPNFNDLDSYDRSSRNNPRHQPSNHLSYVPFGSGEGERISKIAHENGDYYLVHTNFFTNKAKLNDMKFSFDTN